MTSPAKIRVNRRNALRSTGPRSRAGKTIATRNSRRHGFTLPVLGEPALAPEVVAHRIETSVIGRAADAAGHALACRIAEAMIDFKRVRLAKAPLMAALDADPGDTRADAAFAPRSLRAPRLRAPQARDPRARCRHLVGGIDKTKPTQKRK